MEGCPGTKWAKAQTAIFQRHRRTEKRSGTSLMRSIAKRLVDFSFALWDQRNKVNKNRDTSVEIQELNTQVDDEFKLGFKGLKAFGKYSARQVKAMAPYARKSWLRRVRVQRAALARRIERNEPPEWVTKTNVGLVTWMRAGKPPFLTQTMLQNFPELRPEFGEPTTT